jgi:hypothetical protein
VEPHTLLTNTYLYSPRDPGTGKGSLGRKGKLPSRLGGRRVTGGDEDDDYEVTDEETEISLGTLTIGANGEAQFVGASAGSSLLHVSRHVCGKFAVLMTGRRPRDRLPQETQQTTPLVTVLQQSYTILDYHAQPNTSLVHQHSASPVPPKRTSSTTSPLSASTATTSPSWNSGASFPHGKPSRAGKTRDGSRTRGIAWSRRIGRTWGGCTIAFRASSSIMIIWGACIRIRSRRIRTSWRWCIW